MIIEDRDGGPERMVLIACVTRDDFLSRVAGRLGKDAFASRWANLVWSWCREYHRKYGRAPGKSLQGLFEKWARKQADSEVQTMVSRFLASLSREYESQDSSPLEYLLDQATDHLNRIHLAKHREQLQSLMDRGEMEEALSIQEKFKRIDLRGSALIRLLTDEGRQRHALEARQNILVKYPGQAGEFFGEEFSEDSFVGVLASSKGGKSWTLLDIAWRAVRQGHKVAYFQVGDLSLDQLFRRFQIRAAVRPLKPKVVKFPTGITLIQTGGERLVQLTHEERTYEKELTWVTGRKAYKKVCEKYKGELLLSYHPIGTVSARGIQTTLDSWDRDGDIAKVVIIDYAGNLAPNDHKMNPVHQVNDTWSTLRQISDIRKCLVVTAQQANKESFHAWVLTRKNFSESKMILAHVTSFLGVNMTDEEKTMGVLRYNFVVKREDFFSETYCLYCGSCLDVANPVVVSTLPSRR
jgi:hypothetical protein